MSGMPDLDLFYPGSLSLLKLESKRLVSHGADSLTVGKLSSSEQLLKGGKIHHLLLWRMGVSKAKRN